MKRVSVLASLGTGYPPFPYDCHERRYLVQDDEGHEEGATARITSRCIAPRGARDKDSLACMPR